jgi:UDP:flavonoid glycosyltransferase YjiC (YdhE family)
LHEEQVTVIVKTDSDQDASRFGPQPHHVRFTPLAPHAALFSHCDLFISDGILRNLKEALIAGTPALVIPLSSFTDQLYCAERCAALRLGRMISPKAAPLTPFVRLSERCWQTRAIETMPDTFRKR